MGQRLVFRVIKNDEQIATIYYHWSGYTGSIYAEAKYLIMGLAERGYSDDMSVEDTLRMILDILESSNDGHGRCGGVTGKQHEYDAWAKLGVSPKKDMVSRNEGIIDITEEGMKDSIYWAEALEDFNLDTKTFTNSEYCIIDPSDYSDYDIDDPITIPEFDGGMAYFDEVKWSDVDAAMLWYVKNFHRRCWNRRNANTGDIVTVTE